MQVPSAPFSNPLADLIPDDVYALLERHQLLSEKGLRDYVIRARFRTLREANVSSGEAIEMLREEYAYLQFDTLRKIAYKTP